MLIIQHAPKADSEYPWQICDVKPNGSFRYVGWYRKKKFAERALRAMQQASA